MRLIRILVILLILNNLIFLGFIFSKFTGEVVNERISINMTRAVDGDTLDSSVGKIRLLGINTPEKNQLGYQQAKDYLATYTGKQLELEDHGKDKYSRTLGYIFYNNQLINQKILSQGFASLYYYGTDKYYSDMKRVEQEARDASLGIWKKSPRSGCLELVNLQYQEQARCHNQEQLVIHNKCQPIQVTLKDDATHIYEEKINSGEFIMNFSCIWNDEGDSLYVYDDSGLLLFYRYLIKNS